MFKLKKSKQRVEKRSRRIYSESKNNKISITPETIGTTTDIIETIVT